jgi:hypothetical protein
VEEVLDRERDAMERSDRPAGPALDVAGGCDQQGRAAEMPHIGIEFRIESLDLQKMPLDQRMRRGLFRRQRGRHLLNGGKGHRSNTSWASMANSHAAARRPRDRRRSSRRDISDSGHAIRK